MTLTLSYWITAALPEILAVYSCVNLKNTVTGRAPKCFSSKIGPSCRQTELGLAYGWCDDADRKGPMAGTRSGPNLGSCRDWIWDSKKCPPEKCTDIGNGPDKIWGWCNEKDNIGAMKGAPCGPKEGTCKNWIWEAKACPRACPKSGKAPEKCICKGPPLDPWTPYLSTPVKLNGKDDAAGCGLSAADKKGGLPGLVSDNEKLARFGCAGTPGPGITMTKEGGKYRIKDTAGCGLRAAERKGGNGALGSEERLAKFDCASPGDLLEIDGSPDNAKIYSVIEGQRCGLQWAAKGLGGGPVGPDDRVAKFDCFEAGDTMTFEVPVVASVPVTPTQITPKS